MCRHDSYIAASQHFYSISSESGLWKYEVWHFLTATSRIALRCGDAVLNSYIIWIIII